MKRLFVIVVLIIALFTIYVDVTKGTIPTSFAPKNTKQTNNIEKKEYVVMTVEEGDTVFTLFQKANGTSAKNIEKLVSEFKQLNKNLDPSSIQPKKEYKIPLGN